MGDPYAPRVSRSVSEPEAIGELDQFVTRLQLLGATDEEIATVRTTWDDLDEEWTVDQRTALTLLPDDELRAELLATREEYRHDTRTETEQAEVDTTDAMTQAHARAADIIGQPVAKVLEAVGEDVYRAMAVLDMELAETGAQRKTLVEPLRAMVAGEADAEILGEPTGDARGGDTEGSPGDGTT